jgi:hypothetical protein
MRASRSSTLHNKGGNVYIVLAGGARDFDRHYVVWGELSALREQHGNKLLVITGGAPGADTLIKVICDELSIHCAVMTALWSTRYRGAGPQRNQAMGDLVGWDRIKLGLLFHGDLAHSKGTKDMRNRLMKHDVPVRVEA